MGFSEEETPFLLRSVREIAQILGNVHERAALVTAYFGAGSDFALTSILDVAPEEDRFVFDIPSQPDHTRRLVASRHAMFVTHQDGIRIKFAVEGVTPMVFEGRPALVAAMPNELLRLQRREFYRVSCPLSNPVKCTLAYTSEGAACTAELIVLDLSQGGLALMDQHHRMSPEPGMVYENTIIELPGVGSFSTTLEVRNRFEVTLKNGLVTMRAGCRFVRPAANAQGMLQKYTMKLERELNSRLGRGQVA